MVEMIPVKNEKLIAYRVEGEVTGRDFDEVATALEQKLETADAVRVYAEIPTMEGITMEALVADLAFGAKHAGDIGKFERVAVVTREDWISKLAEIEGKALPNVDVKAFPVEERERAMAWALS